MLERPVALPSPIRRIRALLLSVVAAVAALTLTTTVVAPAGATAVDPRSSVEVGEIDAVDRADVATAPTPDDHLHAHTWAVVPGRIVLAHPVLLAADVARGARPAESVAVPAPRDRAPPDRTHHH